MQPKFNIVFDGISVVCSMNAPVMVELEGETDPLEVIILLGPFIFHLYLLPEVYCAFLTVSLNLLILHSCDCLILFVLLV